VQGTIADVFCLRLSIMPLSHFKAATGDFVLLEFSWNSCIICYGYLITGVDEM